jgi:hypothetical protein
LSFLQFPGLAKGERIYHFSFFINVARGGALRKGGHSVWAKSQRSRQTRKKRNLFWNNIFFFFLRLKALSKIAGLCSDFCCPVVLHFQVEAVTLGT